MEIRVPTLEDAQAAAEIAAAEGATRVLLFGSVARGEPHERSDVDLVAVFDDLDYTQRHLIARDINKKIRSQVGVANDVVVTDRPEWEARARGEIPTCLEACISAEAVPLIDNPPTKTVYWDKPMELPVTRLEEAASRVKDIHRQWNYIDITTSMANPAERDAWEEKRNYAYYLLERDQRFEHINGAAHLAVEACLKLLLNLYCDIPSRDMRKHSTGALTKLLYACAPDQADITETLRGEMSHDDISFWHEASKYDIRFQNKRGIYYEASRKHTADLVHLTERFTAHALNEYEKQADNHEDFYPLVAARCRSAIIIDRIGTEGIGLDPKDLPADSNPARTATDNAKGRVPAGIWKSIKAIWSSTSNSGSGTRSGLRRCGKRRADGKPCQHLLKPGSKCPHHPY